MDEPESLGAIGLAARENLDNLIFVINCNLQRLDGPVRGNGKIVQELEGEFRGAGWNVIKLLWGSNWDPLLARDKDGALRKVMMDTLDGDYQAFKANDGAYVRKHFFGRDPRTLEMVAKMSDDDIWACAAAATTRSKVYAAFHAANSHKGQPTVLLVKTVKGYGMGKAGRGQEHRAPDQEAHRRGHPLLPRPLQHPHPRQRAAEDPVLQAGRRHAGDEVPARAPQGAGRLPAAPPHPRPTKASRCPRSRPSRPCWSPRAEGREISTTQAYVRFLTQLLRDQALGPRVVPILVDEARTFGMEGLFRQIGIYNPAGQQYTPVDKDQVMYYRETRPARSCRKASTRPAAWPAGSPRPPATAPTTASWCRSTSTTRCSASSASATWPGRPATCRRAASCWAAPPGAPRSTARACSTRTATATSWPAPSPTASATTRPSRTRSA
jgi:pyruvate dehydrogenase E1 component